MSDSRPTLIFTREPREAPGVKSGGTVTVISYRTAAQTLRCLDSLAACDPRPDRVLVLDNASGKDDFEHLAKQCPTLPHTAVSLYRSTTNLGFAAGSNFLIDAALEDAACRHIVLLNNDAIARPGLLGSLVQALDDGEGDPAGIAGGRMNRLQEPGVPDTLGISLYASLMPANRLDLADPYLGPTGGCCLLSRELVTRLKAVSGYCFDERFFCYCEDTDLALRAVMLGYRPAWTDEVVALHEGQASSGADSEFIAYHGLRNLIWMHVKLLPGPLLAKYGLLLASAHAMTLVRQSLLGRFGLMWRVYRDAFARLPEFRSERARFARLAVAKPADIDARIAPRFYRRGYLGEVLASIFRRWRGRPARDAGPPDR